MHGVVAFIYEQEAGISAGSGAALALLASIGSMRTLLRRTESAYWKAIVLLLILPLYYLYKLYVINVAEMVDRVLYWWWPLVTGVMYLLCVLIVTNEATYRFYARRP